MPYEEEDTCMSYASEPGDDSLCHTDRNAVNTALPLSPPPLLPPSTSNLNYTFFFFYLLPLPQSSMLCDPRKNSKNDKG
jgi:hypothetical protein